MVVVGGGPAGAAAAYHLARRGRSVLVCEKKTFPREKACGDGLTPRAVRELVDMGLGAELSRWQRVEGLRVHLRGRAVAIPFAGMGSWPGYGLVRSRDELDNAVLQNAQAAGAEVLSGAQVVDVLFRRGVAEGVVVRRDGELQEIKSRWIVCAEGAATKLTTTLGRTRAATYPTGFAVRQYFRSSARPSPWFDAFLTVRRGRHIIPGYGWAFPVSADTVNAGVGFLFAPNMGKSKDLQKLQQSFLESIGPRFSIDVEGTKPRGGRLFSGASVWPPHGPGFVLAGDAAGMINPFTGEGISYAYETGRMAATHIADAMDNGSSVSLATYTEDLRSTYGPYYRLGRSFAHLMERPGMLERLASVAMRSQEAMTLITAVLVNLDDESRWLHRTGTRLLKRFADR